MARLDKEVRTSVIELVKENAGAMTDQVLSEKVTSVLNVPVTAKYVSGVRRALGLKKTRGRKSHLVELPSLPT